MRLALLLACFALARGGGLRDHPIAGDSVTYLDGQWTAFSGKGQFPPFLGQVPGDLISDLFAAGQIGNPLYENNFLNSSIWNDDSWTYSTSFDAAPGAKEQLLVFDGIKMGAKIKVNGQELGEANDQFLRYTFALKSHALLPTGNLLTVTFPEQPIECGGRWMACTGGWDWAPYSNTKTNGVGEDAQTFTKGIWKSVYLVAVRGTAIEHFVPHVFYKGDHPTAPLEDGTHAGFQLKARIHLYAPTSTSGKLTVRGSWGASATQEVTLPEGSSNITLTLDAKDVKLWWPAGLGSQPLYNVTAEFSDASPAVVSSQRVVGFRYVAVVTGDDSDPAYVAKAATEEGSDDHGMFFRVNGAAIMSKGANMIPMDNLEGWMHADAHRVLVQSAVDARMNMLRVWGGGIFLPDAWYDACDELGILVYHDMQYAQRGHAPNGTAVEEAELRHHMRRLSHHTSIVIWDGCNECRVVMDTDTGIYATFVLTIVAEEDQSRAIWPSCPAIGWTKGVHKLNALPNGNVLETPPDRDHIIETHGPYRHGVGFPPGFPEDKTTGRFPAVNGHTPRFDFEFDANIPLNLSKADVGLSFQNVYASEFGASVFSSFESMSPTLAPEHWSVHAGQPDDECKGRHDEEDNWELCTGPNVMAQRNYPCDNFLYVYFGEDAARDLNVSSEANFKRQLWQCMIGQALNMKQNIETRMGANTFGILVWQYNEIWPTGGWGSIEYGNPAFPGQVIGGRWKPLQHWYRSSIFADVMATCGTGGLCYLRNDAPRPVAGQLRIRSVAFGDGAEEWVVSRDFSLPAGAGALEWFSSDAVAAVDGTTHILEAVVTEGEAELSRNVIPFATPGRMALQKAKLEISAKRTDENGKSAYVVDVKTDAVAMYVTLTTLAHGRFEDNAFLLTPPGRQVKFIPFEPSPHASADELLDSLTRTVRVEDVSGYNVVAHAVSV